MERYAASDRAALRRALSEGRTGGEGPARLALVAEGPRPCACVVRRPSRPWRAGRWRRRVPGRGAASRRLGFIFTGAACGGAGHGRGALLALPELASSLGSPRAVQAWTRPWPRAGA
ncbi:MAG: hypothetical protein H6740_17155 [Alphaproteobacteria bacterium]|nr:hypothetical protein [Alphaproteobacteria bacterium]